jgi:hypothetical protein
MNCSKYGTTCDASGGATPTSPLVSGLVNCNHAAAASIRIRAGMWHVLDARIAGMSALADRARAVAHGSC